MDFSIFATPEAWISLLTLMFLEVVLGVDNIVFISITTNRLAPEHQHIGRKLGLLGAMISRCIFLCFASYLVHMTKPLFTLDLGFFQHAFNVRDLVLLAGGAYLIYKGIDELRDVLALTEEKAAHSEEHKELHRIGLGQAIATIMVMDLVFSIDSVITAVGLAEHLIIMVMAVIFAKKLSLTVGTFVMIYNVILYILCGSVMHSWILPLYSIVAYGAGLKTVDFVVEGIDRSKEVMIVTDKAEEISAALMEAFECGTTKIAARGGYSDAEKTIIYFVVNRFQISRMRAIIRSIDPKAFVTISDVADMFKSND